MKKGILDDLPRRVFVPEGDKTALTIHEITAETGMGYKFCQRLVRSNLESGRWELVWKRIRGKAIPAYRKK